jgi:hypothetical protein
VPGAEIKGTVRCAVRGRAEIRLHGWVYFDLAAYLQNAYGKERMSCDPMRWVYLMHKRPSPVSGHGGGMCIDAANIH